MPVSSANVGLVVVKSYAANSCGATPAIAGITRMSWCASTIFAVNVPSVPENASTIASGAVVGARRMYAGTRVLPRVSVGVIATPASSENVPAA